MNTKVTEPKAQPRKKQKYSRRVKAFLILASLIVIKFAFNIVGVHITYSEGERAVLVVKLSQKGLIWKTWEGEAALYQGGVAATYIWAFSIDNNDPNKETILKNLNLAFETGQPVKLTYHQVVSVPPWRAGTTYFIKEVIFVNQ